MDFEKGMKMSTTPSKEIEIFENPQKERDYQINIQIPEFTCLCPKTGQPDFAHLTLDYIPDDYCIELKSLKLYIWSFRNQGCFHEAVTNEILDFLVSKINPRLMRLTARFYVRGGIFTNVVAEYRQKDFKESLKLTSFSFNHNICLWVLKF